MLEPTHLFLLPPLPAQLSVGGRHGLDHEGGGHVAAAGKEEGKCTETFKIIRCLCFFLIVNNDTCASPEALLSCIQCQQHLVNNHIIMAWWILILIFVKV